VIFVVHVSWSWFMLMLHGIASFYNLMQFYQALVLCRSSKQAEIHSRFWNPYRRN